MTNFASAEKIPLRRARPAHRFLPRGFEHSLTARRRRGVGSEPMGGRAAGGVGRAEED